MAFDGRPAPAGARLALAGAGAVLALAVFGAMLVLGPGAARTSAVVLGAVAGLALLAVHAVSLSRAGQRADALLGGHVLVAMWSTQAGLTWLWSGEDDALSAAIYIAVGLVFAAVLVTFLWFTQRPDAPPRTDTRPLPAIDTDDAST